MNTLQTQNKLLADICAQNASLTEKLAVARHNETLARSAIAHFGGKCGNEKLAQFNENLISARAMIKTLKEKILFNCAMASNYAGQ